MAKDLIYQFDKQTKKGFPFGEIQTEFNMSFSIDGSKDSCKLVVKTYIGQELEPNTIIYHKKTETWWIVDKDSVTRNMNDSGFFYIHEIQLLGLKELLNARDLIDCGFNQNTYTIRQFLDRLFELSNFEFEQYYNSPINMNEIVKFVKTFENYTLLSAITEFLDGYNCSFTMFFNATIGDENEESEIYDCGIDIIPKTGNTSYEILDIDYFDDVRENKNISRQNFGTTVISNAENVISNKIKVFPSVGAIRPSGSEYNILAQNGFVRLPSNVYKGVWLKFVGQKSPIVFDIDLQGQYIYDYVPNVNPMDYAGIENALKYVWDNYVSIYGTDSFKENYLNAVNRKIKLIHEFIEKAGTVTLYDGNYVNPVDGQIIQGSNVPYLVNVTYNSKFIEGQHPTLPLIFCDKETRDTLPRTYQGIYWERGSDKIDGFNAFETESGGVGELLFDINNCDLRGQSEYVIYNDGNNQKVSIKFDTGAVYGGGHFRYSSWVVAYIPMSDIKIKVDNERTKRDIKLYNQNGKINDNFSLSKLMNSYSKEISSNNITRYKQIYTTDKTTVSFDYVPLVGTLVNNNGEMYVIKNVSVDFYQCESDDDTKFNYYMDCSFDLCKNVSTKSLLVEPNTNIRDYGIPQNYNVKRKQLYRDYYELNYTINEDTEWDYYFSPKNVFRFGNLADTEDDMTAIMKITYSTNASYYFQLPTTTYYMCKMFYLMLDFKDNNVIGYCSQNIFSGFDVSRVFSGMIDTVNTPISYTDSNGNFRDIDVILCSDSALAYIYNAYENANSSDPNYQSFKNRGETLYNYSVLIDQDIYDYALLTVGVYGTISINEPTYNKDAIEVPVFEYACQVADSVDCLIGDNILLQEDNCAYIYSYVTGQNLTPETVVETKTINVNSQNILINQCATIEIKHSVDELPDIRYSYLELKFYAIGTYNMETNYLTPLISVDVPTNIDIAIFRHSYNKLTHETSKELMFICKNVTSSKLYSSKILRMQLNHYKLN